MCVNFGMLPCWCCGATCHTTQIVWCSQKMLGGKNSLERLAKEHESCVFLNLATAYVCTRVRPGTWNLVWIWGDHSPRLNTSLWPIVKQYREGKVKRTPGGEWNSTWNRAPTSSRSILAMWRRAFCRMSQRVTVCGKVKLKNEPKWKRAWIGRFSHML